MIKICSLDFLNNELFEADVMASDGRVLFNSDDKVTPDRLLILYFKEIYVKEALKEKKSKQQELSSSVNKSAKESRVLTPDIAASKVVSEATSGPRSIEVVGVKEEPIVEASKIIDSGTAAQDKKLSPSHIDLGVSERSVSELAEKVENPQLEFDEEAAKRISKYSVKVGELLGFSKIELQELEQAAYYHNIGISKFTRADSLKKGFRKIIAAASYDMILSSLNLPETIADVARSCAYDYDCNAFALNSQVPFCHIIFVASYYEEILSKTNSKSETLNKMLQLGGNKFNIFVLHKFLRIMKDINE